MTGDDQEIDRGVHLDRLRPAGVFPPTTGAEDARLLAARVGRGCHSRGAFIAPSHCHPRDAPPIKPARRPVESRLQRFHSLQRKPSAAFHTGHTGHTGHMGRHHSIWLLLPRCRCRCFSASRASLPLDFCSACSSACSSSALDL